ncbi:MAG: hypothetical protein KGZ42_02970 [Melioribacter sp.]|nr:hypothetical protein [Melioribacter sp.]
MIEKKYQDFARFKTLLALGKTLNTVGQIVIWVGGLIAFMGLVSCIGGDAITKPLGFMALASGLLMVGLGYLIIANGQLIECFVSIEENTRQTKEQLEMLKEKFPNLNS